MQNRFYNNNYTPPNRKPLYPSPGAGSNKSKNGSLGRQPVVTMTNQNRARRNPPVTMVGAGAAKRSPSMVSDSSKKSIRSSGYGPQSRVQTPTSQNRNGNPQGYTSHTGVNRVRRDNNVTTTFNANNPSASKTSAKGSQLGRNNSRKSIGSIGGFSGNRAGNVSDRSRSDRSDNSAKRIEPHKALMSVAKGSKFMLNTRTI